MVSKPLTLALACLALVVVGIGAHTFARAVLMHHHRTDVGAYFRAAWAVKTGHDPYAILDDRGWHYIYPPTPAILSAPFALPPSGVTAGAGLPYAWSIVIWFALSLAAVCAGLHLLAEAIEETSTSAVVRHPRRFGRRWWLLRIIPLSVAGFGIGNTLERGQVTGFLLLCVCGMTAALIRRRDRRAGAWLAAAIVIKIYPAYLLMQLVLLRRRRALLWCMIGLAVGLAVIPIGVMGLHRTLEGYASLGRLVLVPAFSGELNASRMDYLDEANGNISSFRIALFRLAYPNPAFRPASAPAVFLLAHVYLSVLVTVITLWAARPRLARPAVPDPIETTLLAGALTVGLLPMIPLSRDHYFALAAPLVLGLVAHVWDRRGRSDLGGRWPILFGVVALFSIVWEVPGFARLKDFQPVVYDELLLWAAGVVAVSQRSETNLSFVRTSSGAKRADDPVLGAAAPRR